MTDIVIYTNPETWMKKRDFKYTTHYWEMKRMPRKFEQGEDKIWFAVKGYVRGYFEPTDSVGFITKDIPKNSVFWHPQWIETK